MKRSLLRSTEHPTGPLPQGKGPFCIIRQLALSGRFASSSPKGGALGKTRNFVVTAKASPLGRGGIA